LQLPFGTQVDVPIAKFCDFEQVARIVDEQVAVVSQATKTKAKGGKKINKVANKATLKPLEDPTTFVPPSPISLPHMGQPPPTSCWHASTRSPICYSPTSIPS